VTQKAINYGIVLYQLGISADVEETVEKLFRENGQLCQVLSSPTVSREDKKKVVEKVFEGFDNRNLTNFMKQLCDNDGFHMIFDIFEEYKSYSKEREDILEATLYYVTPPTKKQREGIENFLLREHGGKSVELSMVEKKELIGGFVIIVGDLEYDRSVLGRYKSLRQKLVVR
jgi:F-type H+-transporting ATPase subunit delta